MSTNVHLEVASNQLAQDLSQIVDNFTLLDILSKEEQEMVLEQKIDNIKKTNQERMRRYQEIEEDKQRASQDGTTIPSTPLQEPTSPSFPPELPATSPTQQSTSPSADSGLASPASSIEKHGDDGGGGRDCNQDGERVGSGGSRRRQESSAKEPSSMRTRSETIEIDLHTSGTGLGFGVMNFPGIGVTIKTILPDGVAGMDGRLHSGDLLLEINGVDVEKKTRDEVYSILKECKGEVNLVVSREVIQVPNRGPPPQKREGQRRGPPKEAARPKRENDQMVREQKVKRKVTMRGGQQEDLMISVENDQGKPAGRGGGGGGGGGGRGRGRTVRVSKEEVKRREFELKQKDNYDRVEAEIAAMREALENQKATGVTDSPSKSVYSFLDDPARYGADPDHERSAKGNQHSGGRRKQQVRGGQESDVGGGRGRRKDQRGRGGHSQGRGAPESTTETVTMSGKERREYEAWKREREKIDQERIRRHKQATTGDQGMQWNPGKEKAVEEEWKENVTLPAKQEQGDQGEMRIGHWDATDAVTSQRDKRSGGGHFEHDDRVKGQTPDQDPRIGSGRFTQESNQRGRGGGRGFYRGGRGADRGRRGRGGSGSDENRPGRRTSPQSPQNKSPNNSQGDNSRQQISESNSRDDSYGQWQQSARSDWNAGGSSNTTQWESESTKALRDNTESLHIGPLPSPSSASDGVKSPRSPVSPFTPTGHTFLVDWAAEVEARHPNDGSFSTGNDLVYSNSQTNQGF
ncbi:uncharacterized protein [Asterias amurensis]|uniref:uncharacterized protein isoform X2 n=1 Tax=Asterias amurensis TaxID=7602 RepID=UPI003AB2A476